MCVCVRVMNVIPAAWMSVTEGEEGEIIGGRCEMG